MCSLSKRSLPHGTRVGLVLAFISCPVLAAVSGWAQAGSLDTTFANHGIFKTNFANCCGGASAIALQSDGKVLIGGQAPARIGIVLRLNTNGTVDTTFGSGGMATVTLGSVGANVGGLTVQTDGKIVASVSGVFVGRGEFVRLNPNGSVDTTFGNNGFVTISGLIPTGPLVLQPDGKILVAGKEDLSGLLARLDSNGQLDSSFGSGGIAVALEAASQLALLSNGQILASSTSSPFSRSHTIQLQRKCRSHLRKPWTGGLCECASYTRGAE